MAHEAPAAEAKVVEASPPPTSDGGQDEVKTTVAGRVEERDVLMMEADPPIGAPQEEDEDGISAELQHRQQSAGIWPSLPVPAVPAPAATASAPSTASPDMPCPAEALLSPTTSAASALPPSLASAA